MSQAPTVTLVLPREFLELCERDRITPEAVLRGFIADLCEITPKCPQADGYRSNGADERVMAQEYYHRVDYYYRFDDTAVER